MLPFNAAKRRQAHTREANQLDGHETSQDSQQREESLATVVLAQMQLVSAASHMLLPLIVVGVHILTGGRHSSAFWHCLYQAGLVVLWQTSASVVQDRYLRYTLRLPLGLAVAVGLLLQADARPDMALRDSSAVVTALVAGLLAGTCWVCLAQFMPARVVSAWNPLRDKPGSVGIAVAAVRVVHSSSVVPLFEELYNRSFLPRALQNIVLPQGGPFTTIPLSQVHWPFAAVVSVLFAAAGHTRFPGETALAVVFGMVMHALTQHFNSLGPPILAHAVCNLCLSCAVLFTGNFKVW